MLFYRLSLKILLEDYVLKQFIIHFYKSQHTTLLLKQWSFIRLLLLHSYQRSRLFPLKTTKAVTSGLLYYASNCSCTSGLSFRNMNNRHCFTNQCCFLFELLLLLLRFIKSPPLLHLLQPLDQILLLLKQSSFIKPSLL